MNSLNSIAMAQECWKRAEIEPDPFRRALFELAGNCLEDTKCLHGREALNSFFDRSCILDSETRKKYEHQTPESVLLDLVIETLNPDGE